ncbi:ATP-dependent DNA helicase Q1-like isoform X2 [Dreissena polymorpha]|nr:ATP-dependent DNA helicase Q1-like isoform X2 [Dreissena polymorpha]
MIVIVIAPINAIMEEQVRELRAKGIMACSLSYSGSGATTFDAEEDMEDTDCDDKVILPKEVTMKELMDGKYHIIYTHPECLFQSKAIAKMIRSKNYQEHLCGIVIDEVHMILEWGPEFRPKFERLGELTCLHPQIAHVALTATAKPESINTLAQSLMYKNVTVVAVNPDRPNIFIDVRNRPPNIRKVEKYNSFIEPLAHELDNKMEKFPLTIAYIENLEALGYCYQVLNSTLKEKQYNGKEHIPENRLFAQFHTDYTADMKKHIITDLCKRTPTTRLILATVALGMGLNAPSVERVMHMRPPVCLENYLQEIGRAGRTGQQSSAVLFFNNSDIASNRKGMTKEMVDFCQNTETCLRLQLVKYFGFDNVLYSGTKENCCKNCREKFKAN